MAGTQRFDNAIREVVTSGATALCRWLLSAPLEQVVPVPARLTSAPIEADGVFDLGARGILHVEFELGARADRLHERLVDYWARLNRQHGVAPEQHVVVLSPSARLPGEFRSGGLRLRYRAHHLWEVDAEELLAFDALVPLAVLARPPSGRTREELVAEVARTIHRRHRGERRRVLAEHAATLANVHLGRPTLETIFRRWTDMAVDLRVLPMFREAREEGRYEGRLEGRLEGRAELACRVLEARLGPLGAARMDAVHALDSAALDRLADALLTIEDLAAVDAWLAGR